MCIRDRSLCIYQFGTWFVTGSFGLGTAAALAVLAAFIYLLIRPHGEKKSQGIRVKAQNAA